MNNEQIDTTGLQDFLIQLAVLYSKHNSCSYDKAMDVDLEDICDYFGFIIQDDNRKKQTDLLNKFSDL